MKNLKNVKMSWLIEMPNKVKDNVFKIKNHHTITDSGCYKHSDHHMYRQRSIWPMLLKMAGKDREEVRAKITPLLTEQTWSDYEKQHISKLVGYQGKHAIVRDDLGKEGKATIRDVYFDSNNILRKGRKLESWDLRKSKNKKKTNPKDHYERLNAKAKSERESEERNSIYNNMLDTLFNKPEILRFYQSLHSQYKDCLMKINKESYGGHWASIYKYDASEARKKLPKILHDMKLIESGDYGGWFKSSTYMQGLQKECHHVDSPHKPKP